ncbi:hypothetical protein ACFYXH_23615 [Streptomyces sp. NPDC002730]|uniref:hypothetical protein n=1 Tax=Streptomyces sp. NPDC002730 TaxID=3364662 RepID=UPI00369F8505
MDAHGRALTSERGERVMNTQDVPSYPTLRTNPFDPPAELAARREQEPISRIRYPDGHLGWLVTSHSLARQLLSDPRFSARSEFKRAPVARPGVDPYFGVPALPGWILDMDPPEHTRIRQQLTGKFTARRMREMRPQIERECLRLTCGAAHTAVELTEGLVVRTDRMHENLGLTGSLMMSERLAAVLAPRRRQQLRAAPDRPAR